MPPPRSLDSPRFPPPPAARCSRRRSRSPSVGDDPDIKALAHLALDAARSAGASYADVRFATTARSRSSPANSACRDSSTTRPEASASAPSSNGAWGFAASRELSRDEVARVARQAVEQARANASPLVRPVVLAPVTPVARGTWRTPIEIDPFTVSDRGQGRLLLAANAAALAAGARFVNSSMFFLREEKTFASSDGSYIVQTIYRTQPSVTVTAVSSDQSDFQTRSSNEVAPMGRGYEHVRDAKLVENAPGGPPKRCRSCPPSRSTSAATTSRRAARTRTVPISSASSAWYRDRVLKALLALLIGTLSFSFALLRHVEANFVPNLGTSIAGVLLLAGLLLFVIFLDRFLHRLRPVAVASLVSGYIRRDFARNEQALSAAPDVCWGVAEPGGQPTLVVRSEIRGAIQAVDVHGLIRWTRAHGSLLVVRRSMGDFVPTGAKLLEIYGGHGIDARDEEKLRDMVALGAERTIEQDPGLAVRIMVDIADKALSAAINDPTTAVQVLDHLSDVLRVIGTVDLSGARWDPEQPLSTGMVVPVRRWEDYLVLATTEIREYGSRSIQVMRRMRAMLLELHDEVLPAHRAAVEEELARLDATVIRSFGDSIDLDRASVADARGSAAVSALGAHTWCRQLRSRVGLKHPTPARENLVHADRSDDPVRRHRELDRVQDERLRLGPAQAAVEGDQLLERAALFELRVIEAVDQHVGDVLEAVGPEQVRRGRWPRTRPAGPRPRRARSAR